MDVIRWKSFEAEGGGATTAEDDEVERIDELGDGLAEYRKRDATNDETGFGSAIDNVDFSLISPSGTEFLSDEVL